MLSITQPYLEYAGPDGDGWHTVAQGLQEGVYRAGVDVLLDDMAATTQERSEFPCQALLGRRGLNSTTLLFHDRLFS